MITIAAIQGAVAREFNVPSHLFTEPRPKGFTNYNTFAVSHPRQVAMTLSYLLTEHSMTAIGRKFGGRDHTTIIHARRATEKRRRADPALHTAMRRLTFNLINGGAS